MQGASLCRNSHLGKSKALSTVRFYKLVLSSLWRRFVVLFLFSLNSRLLFFFVNPDSGCAALAYCGKKVPIRSNIPFYSRSLGTLLLLESTCQRLVALFPPCDLCSRNVKLRGHLLQRYPEIPGRFLPIEPAHRTSSACGHVKGFSSCLGLPYGPRHTSHAP